jgi:hypothetical protein
MSIGGKFMEKNKNLKEIVIKIEGEKWEKALDKAFKGKFVYLKTTIASISAPIINTGIFALGMLTIFGDALMADPEISTWSTGGLFALVFLVLIGVNYFVELASTTVITPALSKALLKSKFFK